MPLIQASTIDYVQAFAILDGNDTFHHDNNKNLAKDPTYVTEISKKTLAILAIEVNSEVSNIDNVLGRNIIENLQKFEIKLKSWQNSKTLNLHMASLIMFKEKIM